jgi:hypothetical protein
MNSIFSATTNIHNIILKTCVGKTTEVGIDDNDRESHRPHKDELGKATFTN